MITTSIRLTAPEVESLQNIATKLRCHSRHGATSGEPSWRIMVQHLAQGRLIIIDPLQKSLKLFVNFQRPPGWWVPDERGAMLAVDVAKKYKTTVEILEEKGFVLDGEWIFPGPWKGWACAKTAPQPPTPTLPEIDLSTIPEPEWFIRSPIGAPVMRVPDAMEQSGESVTEIVANGAREITVNGMKLITGPVGSSWDFSRFTPGEKPKSGTNDS